MADTRTASVTSTNSPLPTGKTPSREDFRLTQAEISTTAGFGPAPEDWFLAPQYAWRVAARQRALQGVVKQLNAELEQAERERDERLAQIVTALRPKFEAEARWFRLLEPVHAAEESARQRSERLAGSNAKYGAELGKIETRRGEVERGMAERLKVDQERSRVLAEVDHEFKRTEGHLKRIQIEIRNASQSSEQTDGAEPTGNDTHQLSELREQASNLARKLDELSAQLKSAQFDVDLVRGEIDDLDKERKRLDEQRKEVDHRYREELSSRTVTVSDAERIERQALADAGRALLAEREKGLLDDTTISTLRSLDDNVSRAARALEMHLAALDAFEQDAVRRGRTLVAAAVVALMILVFAMVWFS